MYTYDATLIRVVDGDTIDLLIDLGLDEQRKIRIRLEGLNCPEHNEPGGPEATAFTTEWFAKNGPQVIVKTRKDETEKYGRYLADVFAVGGSSLNLELVKSGHAVAYFGGMRAVPSVPLAVPAPPAPLTQADVGLAKGATGPAPSPVAKAPAKPKAKP